jgi:RNA-splicing ligase RtcB
MEQACRLPMAISAALMPDAHVGYGLPIGGVLALDNAVVPYAVGVDIACRMKLSVLDVAPENLKNQESRFEDALQRGTRFGIGSEHATPQDHPVMDEDWSVTRTTREKKDIARKQLGTSGSGNHFVEFGMSDTNPTAAASAFIFPQNAAHAQVAYQHVNTYRSTIFVSASIELDGHRHLESSAPDSHRRNRHGTSADSRGLGQGRSHPHKTKFAVSRDPHFRSIEPPSRLA